MDYPDDRDVLELAEFEIDESVSFTYRFNHIARTLRALQNSTKTSLRADFDGLLSLQFQLPLPRSDEFYNIIDFRCAAVIDDP